MEVIQCVRNLFNDKYKEDRKKPKENIFIDSISTRDISACRKLHSKNIFWPIGVLQVSALGSFSLSLCIYDIDPLFWNAKCHLSGGGAVINRSNKYLHSLSYQNPVWFG